MKEIFINKYQYTKTIESSVPFKLPELPIYLFEFHVRRSIKVTPVWTTWNKEKFDKEEEIFMIEFVLVYSSFKSKIKKLSINTSQIEQEINTGKGELFELLEFLNEYDEENIRTKEQFDTDFTTVLNNITK